MKMRSTGYNTAMKRELVKLDCLKKSIKFCAHQVRGQTVLITGGKKQGEKNELCWCRGAGAG